MYRNVERCWKDAKMCKNLYLRVGFRPPSSLRRTLPGIGKGCRAQSSSTFRMPALRMFQVGSQYALVPSSSRKCHHLHLCSVQACFTSSQSTIGASSLPHLSLDTKAVRNQTQTISGQTSSHLLQKWLWFAVFTVAIFWLAFWSFWICLPNQTPRKALDQTSWGSVRRRSDFEQKRNTEMFLSYSLPILSLFFLFKD